MVFDSKTLCGAVLLISMFSCKNPNTKTAGADTVSNVIPIEETEIKLFDGASLLGWHGFNKGAVPIENWTVIDSALVCLGTEKDATGGDLVTDREYENFQLDWDWKIDDGSNSGVMYHVVEDPKYKSAYETGPEYQIIDDVGFPQRLESWQKTGADYAMYGPNSFKKLNEPGKWNHSKIVFDNGHVEHWLNGQKIVAFEAWSEDWKKKKMAGKWKDYPDYGLAKKGRIALQDHGHKAYFKNIILIEL